MENMLVCPICGEKFHRKPSYIAKSKEKLCCSLSCRRELLKTLYKGRITLTTGKRLITHKGIRCMFYIQQKTIK